MDAQNFLDNFTTIADAPGGIQQLRDLVLDLAVRGRLVGQDPSDEPAGVLLKRIKAHRQQLVNDRKMSRPKGFPPAPAGVNQEPLPLGWTWTYLAEALTWDLTDGDWVESKDQDPEGRVRLIQLADVGVAAFKDKSVRFLTEETAERLRCTELKSGDVLIARLPHPLGRACIFPGSDRTCVTVVDVAIARTDQIGLHPEFLVHSMNAPSMRQRVDGVAAGTTRKRVSTGNLRKLPIAVPPLAEQKRIVIRVDELMGLCEKLESRLAHQQIIATHLAASAVAAIAV